MFTGLVETLAPVLSLSPPSPGRRLRLHAPTFANIQIGESIAVNGVCLTVVGSEDQTVDFEVGPETLKRTNLGQLSVGNRVNLERSLCLGDRLGGHLVTGHIDGTGTIDQCQTDGDWVFMWFRCSPELTAQMAPKGSVTVDGISLTLVDVERECFSVALIPHTLEVTTLGFKGVGETVNLETDLLAKYVHKALASFAGTTNATNTTSDAVLPPNPFRGTGNQAQE